MPFGKYAGRPVEDLLADRDYCEWLLMQPWFRERHAGLAGRLDRGGIEPQETPEHNEMQARFLDDGLCLRLADLLYGGFTARSKETAEQAAWAWLRKHPGIEKVTDWSVYEASVASREFEQDGWDVALRLDPANIDALIMGCSCRGMYHGEECPAYPYGEVLTKTEYLRPDGTRWSFTDPWADRPEPTEIPTDKRVFKGDRLTVFGSRDEMEVRAELKPDLGDDYPAVLRQVKRYMTGKRRVRAAYGRWHDENVRVGGKCCVIARRAQFSRVSYEKVRQVFAGSGITLLMEADLG